MIGPEDIDDEDDPQNIIRAIQNMVYGDSELNDEEEEDL